MLQRLHEAGEKKLGTDETTFNVILGLRSRPHLNAVFDEYLRIAHCDFEKAIKSEFSGDIEDALLAVVKSTRNPPAYFAEVLKESMSGLGTNEDKLIRTMVSRSEYDLGDIKQEFQKMFGKSLADWIEDDTSGKFKKTLIMLVNGNTGS